MLHKVIQEQTGKLLKASLTQSSIETIYKETGMLLWRDFRMKQATDPKAQTRPLTTVPATKPTQEKSLLIMTLPSVPSS